MLVVSIVLLEMVSLDAELRMVEAGLWVVVKVLPAEFVIVKDPIIPG